MSNMLTYEKPSNAYKIRSYFKSLVEKFTILKQPVTSTVKVLAKPYRTLHKPFPLLKLQINTLKPQSKEKWEFFQ